MNLLEYEAKKLLANAHILVPAGRIITPNSTEGIRVPVVLKSQVPAGGRGKLGGIKIVDSEKNLSKQVAGLFQKPIKGFLPQTVLAEERLDIDQEFYLAILINRAKQSIELSAHPDGGVDIESQQAGDFLHIPLTTNNHDMAGDALAELFDLPEQTFQLQDLVAKLYKCFVNSDATLLEINPLVLTHSGDLMAGDCKMVLDDAASFRHPEWNFESIPSSANFVTLNRNGTVATIANGAGLAMATVDAVTAQGLKPANFLDIGGSATTEKVVESFKTIMDFPQVSAIVINIFGGIVRCDIVAQAIIEARSQLPNLADLYIRLSGNNSQMAAELLEANGMKLYKNLEDCLQEIKK